MWVYGGEDKVMRRLCFAALPDSVDGITEYDAKRKEYFTVINSGKSMEVQVRSFRHEHAHITFGHFVNTAISLEEAEEQAEAYAMEGGYTE